jgi:hypothetical protein
MPTSKPFPSKESELNIYFQNSGGYLNTNSARLLVSAANKTLLTSQLATWNVAYPLSQNPDTRTATTIDNKNVARDKLMATIRQIFADIPASVLTDQDRNVLGISAPNTTRSRNPVPVTKPIAQVDTSNRLEHIISFTDEDGSSAKPDGVRGCQIWIKIGSAATDPSELSYIATDTRSPYIYTFDGKDAGKVACYWLRWENTRGETGPWSDAVMATITA